MDNSKDGEKKIEEVIAERLTQLPKVVQDAIRSGDVTQHMKKLAETHKLHVDQWESLEREVQFTLLGLQPAEELEQNIKSEVGVSDEIAHALTLDIAQTVFEPVREALERELSHPAAKKEEVSPMETSRQEALASEHAAATTSIVAAPPRVPVVPATPPPPPPQGAAKRAPISASYLPSAPSHERKSVDGDPYREPAA